MYYDIVRHTYACSLAGHAARRSSSSKQSRDSRLKLISKFVTTFVDIVVYTADFQEEEALLQGSTYTFKVKSNTGYVYSIPAKLVNPCEFLNFSGIPAV